jgi:hypothetical protein
LLIQWYHEFEVKVSRTDQDCIVLSHWAESQEVALYFIFKFIISSLCQDHMRLQEAKILYQTVNLGKHRPKNADDKCHHPALYNCPPASNTKQPTGAPCDDKRFMISLTSESLKYYLSPIELKTMTWCVQKSLRSLNQWVRSHPYHTFVMCLSISEICLWVPATLDAHHLLSHYRDRLSFKKKKLKNADTKVHLRLEVFQNCYVSYSWDNS